MKLVRNDSKPIRPAADSITKSVYFALDLWRSVRVPRKDQNHNATGFDRIDIDSPQSAPGTTSRGAIQHVTESASSRATIASATALSFVE